MSKNSVGSVSMDLTLDSKKFTGGLSGLKSQFSSLAGGVAGVATAALNAANHIAKMSAEWMNLYKVQEQAEVRLQTIMQQRMGASKEQIQQIKDYASELQGVGVLGDEVLLTGGQQLASFLNSQESLQTLMKSMADLTAQQKGVDATASDATTYANMIGKAMANNSLSSLTRSGITVTEEEQKRFEAFTNEEEKAAYLAQIIKNNVGEMNKALANTPTGKIQQMKNAWGDLKETLGSIASSVLASISGYLTTIINKINTALQAFSKLVSKVFGTDKLTGQVTGGVSDISDTVADGTEAIGDSASSAAKKITRAVAPFDKLNKIANNTQSDSGSGGVSSTNTTGGILPDGETEEENSKLDKLKEKIKEIKDAWTTGWNNGFKADVQKFKDNIGRIGEAVKNIFSDKNVQGAMNNLMLQWVETIGTFAGAVTSIGVSLGTWLTGGIARALEDNLQGIKDWIVRMADEASLYLERVANFWASLADIFTVFESEQAETALANLISIFGEAIGTISEICLKFGSDFFNFLTQPIIDNTEKIKETLLNIFEFLSGHLENIRLVIHSVCENVLKLYDEHIRPLIQSLTDSLSEWFGIILDGWNQYVDPVLQNLNAKFKEVIENYVIPFINKLGEELGDVIDAVKYAWDNVISPLVSWLLKNLMPVLGTVLKVLGDIATIGIKTLFAALNFILDPIEGVKNAFSVLIDIGGDVLNCFFDLGEGVVGIFNGIVDTVKGAINGVIGIINNMIDGINNLNIDIPNPFGEDKHIGFNIPHIPQLANGGYVGPNNPQLAVIGDNRRYGEVIANDKQLSDLGNTIINGVVGAIGSVTGGTQPVYLTVQIGEDDITDIVASSVNKYQKRTGKRIF